MTKPVDLDALDAAYLDVSNGQWLIRRGVENIVHVIAEDRSRVTAVAMTNDGFTARWIASSRNAYPALSAELRALREVAEAARVVLDADINMSGVELSQEQIDALRAALAKVPR